MIPREFESSSHGCFPSLHLDCGADSDHGTQGGFEISERGMRFQSRWQFSIGTQLSVALQQMHPQLGQIWIRLEGIVVWCEPAADKRFESTILFLELPDELRPSLREFSHLATING